MPEIIYRFFVGFYLPKIAGSKLPITTGKQSRKEEAKLIGKSVAKAILLGLLAAFIKNVVQHLIVWFKSGNRKLKTFADSLWESVKSFVSNLLEQLKIAANTALTTIATAIFRPIIGTIKKAWIFLKQGYKSVKDAVAFLKNPANKDMPFSIKMMQVGKIVIAGLAAGGSILLGEVFEKVLTSIPVFAFEIPLLGSLASIIGLFMGALVSGIVGALALNLIDKMISKKLKLINDKQRIEKSSDILEIQRELIDVKHKNFENTKTDTIASIKKRHKIAAESIRSSLQNISDNSKEIAVRTMADAEAQDISEPKLSENDEMLNAICNNLNLIK